MSKNYSDKISFSVVCSELQLVGNKGGEGGGDKPQNISSSNLTSPHYIYIFFFELWAKKKQNCTSHAKFISMLIIKFKQKWHSYAFWNEAVAWPPTLRLKAEIVLLTPWQGSQVFTNAKLKANFWPVYTQNSKIGLKHNAFCSWFWIEHVLPSQPVWGTYSL